MAVSRDIIRDGFRDNIFTDDIRIRDTRDDEVRDDIKIGDTRDDIKIGDTRDDRKDDRIDIIDDIKFDDVVDDIIVIDKGGCTDPTALNYDRNATYDNGSCKYKVVDISPKETRKELKVLFKVNQKGFTVKVDGRDNPQPIIFSNTELLTPKLITVCKGNFKANTTYRVSTKKRQQRISTIKSGVNNFIDPRMGMTGFGNTYVGDIDTRLRNNFISDTQITYSYRDVYEVCVERLVNGKFVYTTVPGQVVIAKNLLDVKVDENNVIEFPKSITLDFTLDKIVIDDPVKFNILEVKADIPGNNLIKYTSEKGDTGFIINGTQEIKLTRDETFIEFGPNTEFDENGFNFSYQLNTDKIAIKSPYRRVSIKGKAKQSLSIQVSRIVIDAPDPVVGKTPIVAPKNGKSFSFNVLQKNPLEIVYSSANATEVRYSLGKVQKKIIPSGKIKLTNADFPNGIGNYVLYLQGYSEVNGTGPVEKIPIQVFSKQILPGPDITHINYPQLVRGADFKGFNVDFKVSWQSVNTDYIYIYAGKPSKESALGKFSPAGAATFNIGQLLNVMARGGGKALDVLTSGRDLSKIPLYLEPFNARGDSLTKGKLENVNITFDKGDLTLRRGVVVNSIRNAYDKGLKYELFQDEISKFLTHYLHIGDGDNKLVATWGIDTETFNEYEDGFNEDGTPFRKKLTDEKSLVLKLYEPLPRNIGTNDSVWISKAQSIPLIEQITILDEIAKECTPLTPNFDLEIGDDIGYQILDDLVASGSATSTDLVNKFVSGSGFELDNLNFNFVSSSDYNWKDFVKFSSAEERARNFFYKVETIQFYENKKNNLTVSQPASSSVAVLNEVKKLDLNIKKLENNFDAFEKYLYTTSGSLSYPGAGQNAISSSTNSDAISWKDGIVSSAQTFDELNSSRLSYNLPAHIINNTNNDEFTLFFDMIGQHYDVIYSHIRQITKSKKAENKFIDGINDELIYHMLESLGWNADEGVQSQFLWEFAFGKDKDGTQSRALSGKARQQEIWRRILNNLPYLLKHKGSKRALHALLSCYGVPASLLTIVEFGGPRDIDSNGTTKFTYEDRTASIGISGSESISIPWDEVTSTSDHPNAIEFRYKTSEKQEQQIVSGSQWSLSLVPSTGSLASVKLEVSGSTTLYSASTDTFPCYNTDYIYFAVNKETISGEDYFDVYVKETIDERLKTDVSKRLIVPTISGWSSGSYVQFGGSTITGSLDEVRLWKTPLSSSRLDNHAFLPDAIDGNHVSSSTEDLLFRLDFEYPKNRSTSGDPYIKNVAPINTYATFATASNFENISSYPYQYVSYDRTVTATVPSSGFNYSNKVRFETQTLTSNLSYRSRATKKSFDQAPIDSDKLGLFFSPIKEINMDILKSVGNFNIDDYIGDPADEYNYEYKKLNDLRNYYFDRYTLNLHEYIQLVRYIDKTLFKSLESLVPARAKVASGLLIEPHILERSKTKWTKPTGTENYHEGIADVGEDVVLTSTAEQYLAEVSASEDTILSGDNNQFEGLISESTDIPLTGTHTDFQVIINTEVDKDLSGVITRNSGSDMGGFDISIDALVTQSVQGQVDTTEFVQVGNDPNGISNQTFGIYAENGHSNITRIFRGEMIKERRKVYILKERYTVAERVNIDSNDSSLGTEVVNKTKHRFKVTKLPITGSDGNPTTAPSVAGDIVEVTALDGYSNQHYRFVEDVTHGLENSFYNGSLQTSATTVDGSSPVQTFTTNPNTLKVSDSGRGSGEPILEVD